MIIGNTCTEIGDVLIINTTSSINGSFQLTTFTDSITGTTGTRFFNKEFSISSDGLTYTSWLPLDNTNLATINGISNGTIFIKLRYTRSGSDTTGNLTFVSITILSTVTSYVCNKPVTSASIFTGLCCGNVVVNQLADNLLKKLYKRGIVPEYIERGEGSPDDDDYVDFWQAICCYFAMFVVYMQKFENIDNDRKLLLEYLKQNGLFFCENDITLSDAQYLSQHFFDEIRKRGTNMIAKRKNLVLLDIVNPPVIVPIDGELLRLICYEVWHEFLFELLRNENTGWCMNLSSPLWKGTHRSTQLNKTLENSEDFQNLSNFYTTSPTGTTISIVTDPMIANAAVLKIFGGVGAVPIGTTGGLGFCLAKGAAMPGQINVSDGRAIVIDPNVDYEITIRFRLNMILDNGAFPPKKFPAFKFGVKGFDINGNYLPLAFKSILTSFIREDFFIHQSNFVDVWNDNEYYFVRGIIYAKNSIPVTNPYHAQTNIGEGENLRFNETQPVNYIVPHFGHHSFIPWVNNNGSGFADYGQDMDIRLHDYKVRPLTRGKNSRNLKLSDNSQIFPQNVSVGFVQAMNLVFSWIRNENGSYTNDEVDEIISQFLIPYNSKLISIHLNTDNITKWIFNFTNFSDFPTVGAAFLVYVDLSTTQTYIWNITTSVYELQ